MTKMATRIYLPFLILPCLLIPALADDSRDLCTWDGLESSYGRSFTPWFRAWPNVTSGPGGSDKAFVNNMACWWYADCIFSLAPETRKQQYGAISIVMALLPLLLKDIAWPHRRIVLRPKKTHWAIEILIRGLGLNPIVPQDQTEIVEGKTFNPFLSGLILALLIFFLLLTYAMLVVMEVYSKRSSLGCPVPAFVMLWFFIAILPAVVEVAFSRFRGRKGRKSEPVQRVSESIQGGEQHWIVQVCWGLYYSAGGLIFTSIMLVSVGELFTWMLLAGAATAASKLLAYKLCGFWGTGFE